MHFSRRLDERMLDGLRLSNLCLDSHDGSTAEAYLIWKHEWAVSWLGNNGREQWRFGASGRVIWNWALLPPPQQRLGA